MPQKVSANRGDFLERGPKFISPVLNHMCFIND